MKTDPTELLNLWEGDRDPTPLPEFPRTKTLFHRFYLESLATFDFIETQIRNSTSEDEGYFDYLYRHGHVVYGMSELLKIPKVRHLLALLDVSLDLARKIRSFEKYSLRYLVSLYLTTARSVLEEFRRTSQSTRDLFDTLEESRSYLTSPLKEMATVPVSLSEPTLIITVPETIPAPSPLVVSAPTIQEDDGPESLDIPIDKAGLISGFFEESRENLATIGHRLIELEDASEPIPLVNDLFRSVHTVKGGARLLKIRKIETLAHAMESLLDQVRKGTLTITADGIDVLLDGKTQLESMVEEVASRGPIRTRINPCLQAIARVQSGKVSPTTAVVKPVETPVSVAEKEAPPRPEPSRPAPVTAESIRIPTQKLDEVLNSASEVFISRIRLASDVADLNAAITHFKTTLEGLNETGLRVVQETLQEGNRKLSATMRTAISTVRHPVVERLQSSVNRFHQDLAELINGLGTTSREELMLNLLSIEETSKRLQKNIEHLEQLSGRLQSGAMSFRMVPIAQLFDRFPTQVRELARQLGKKVHLDISGNDTELDKVLINQLSDPLLHILRNSLDHGIELPEIRRSLGKPEAGQLSLRAYYHGSHVVIEVGDDGKGINVDRVLEKAIENGLVPSEKRDSLSTQEILDFVFAPGLSTAAQVSKVSGRGVGMDVVKTALGQVQGSVTIETTPGRGTTIRMRLPLTVAVVGILLVRERTNQFAFPIQNVHEILMAKVNDVRRVGDSTTYNYRGTTLPVTTLSSVLGFPPSLFADGDVPLVILAEGEKRIGVLVDAVLGRQEVLIKSLGSVLKSAPFMMGCTIQSDGRLLLILNVIEVVNARDRTSVPVIEADLIRSSTARKNHTILIVDDSAIQRNHISSILTQAGYQVDTADNGFEGLKHVRSRHYSSHLVDIQMPLMDGFDYIERLKQIPGQEEVPVFVISSRTSRADRDRAAELKVLAYFEKPVHAEELIATLDRHCLGSR
jgi:two-component system chemotaxis sensor kinase CheA